MSTPKSTPMSMLIRSRLAAAYQHCAEVARRSDSNFHAAFWLFPRDQRRGLHAVYAFCRLADDIADAPGVEGDRARLLASWRELLDDAYVEKSNHPVGIALGDTVHRFKLRKSWFEELLTGIESDLHRIRFERFEDLEDYCYRVASTVGSMVLGLRGVRGESIEDYVRHLGIGVQLTNVLRDVRKDATDGRVYIAVEDLDAFGVDADALVRGPSDPQVLELFECYARRARTHYDLSQRAMPLIHLDSLRPAQAMGAIYRDLLAVLEDSGFEGWNPEHRPSKARRVSVAARSWWTGALP
jgi:phytoene synthase